MYSNTNYKTKKALIEAVRGKGKKWHEAPTGSVVATTTAKEIADFVDPTGALRKAGLLAVVHVGKKQTTTEGV